MNLQFTTQLYKSKELNTINFQRAAREQKHISLRKETLDNYLMRKRLNNHQNTSFFNQDSDFIIFYKSLLRNKYDPIDAISYLENVAKENSNIIKKNETQNSQVEIIRNVVALRRILCEPNPPTNDIISNPYFELIFYILDSYSNE